MAKVKSNYVCQSCGYASSQWTGQCGGCGEWNTLVETVVAPSSSGARGFNKASSGSFVKTTPLSKVVSQSPKRISSGLLEFDRVLGGGFVPGQVILLAGDPGIGKSTILTQISKNMSDLKILYVSGEESVEQVKIRSDRMNYQPDNLYMLPETDAEVICTTIEGEKDLGLIIVDSIQTLYTSDLLGMAGSVGQVRGCAQKITSVAKKVGVPTILVGHVTKEGTVAGPKVLEHIVDTVLYLEGDEQHLFRILKTTKNRFGPVSEVGIFEMAEEGLREVANPSELFLSQRLEGASGSCIAVVMEGFRPMLFEIQALAVKTSFGYPRRTTTGFNANRLLVLIALLEKRVGLNVSQYDIYLSVSGGLKVSESAADLAVCLAIASAVQDKPIIDGTAVFGECGLSGELRRVSHMEKRAKEAKKLGYTKIISPESYKTLKQALKVAYA